MGFSTPFQIAPGLPTRRTLAIRRGIALLTVCILLALFDFARNIRTGEVVEEYVDYPSERFTDEVLVKRLRMALRTHPTASHYKLFWKQSDYKALDYDKTRHLLLYRNGNSNQDCQSSRYWGVTPQIIDLLAEKRGKMPMLKAFGCEERVRLTGGRCQP